MPSAKSPARLAQVPQPYTFSNLYDRRTPYVMQYLFNVQREFSQNLVLEVGYLGSVSRKLESLRAVNEAIPGATGSVISRSPYPTFGRIQLVDNGGTRQLQLTRREADQALLERPQHAGVVHLGEVDRRNQRHPRQRRRHAVPAEQLLHALRTRPVAPSIRGIAFVTSVLYDLPVRQRSRDEHR